MSMTETAELTTKYRFFPWRLIRAAFYGKSVIDTPYLAIESLDASEHFLSRYGYDWNNLHHRKFLQNSYKKALDFVQTEFIDPFEDELEIPEILQKCSDLRQLIYWSNPKAFHRKVQLWACALLKVLHTVLHLENDFLIDYFQEARRQIFERFDGHLHVDENNRIYLGHNPKDLIPLHHFEVKKEKNFNSRLIKLLHKAENTAATIHDRIGVRIVAKTLTETLSAFSYLARSRVILISSIAATRSKNTLMDLDKYQLFINRLLKLYHNGEISFEEFERRAHEEYRRSDFALQEPVVQEVNPHTLTGFQAVQFTCRHLVRFPNPTWVRLADLKENLIREKASACVIEQTEEILEQTRREIRFFFPYEIQLMDKEAWHNNLHGKGSHTEYKQNQLTTARKRVLGKLIPPNVRNGQFPEKAVSDPAP